jgi:hypothetical protein
MFLDETYFSSFLKIYKTPKEVSLWSLGNIIHLYIILLDKYI